MAARLQSARLQLDDGWGLRLAAGGVGFHDARAEAGDLHSEINVRRRQDMEQRISLITLAVGDLEKSRDFYQQLGWKPVESPPGVVAFDLIGQTLGLFARSEMLDEVGLSVTPMNGGFSGVILSHNVRDKAEIAPLLDRARAAGARIVKSPQDTPWGGHHGHFADPDGHVWEVAFNPFSTLGADGAFQWNGIN